MTDNKYFKAFTRVFAITLTLIMVLGAVMTETAAAFSGKVGSKYTVHWYKELHYGPGEGGYSNAAKCDLGDDLMVVVGIPEQFGKPFAELSAPASEGAVDGDDPVHRRSFLF